MSKPRVHLICNAHLDPVWQWRWEEGCAEAIATFRTAVKMLREHDQLIFNHNEAILYRWVQKYDPPTFKEIQQLVKEGRWFISSGWHLQPDVNLPGTESIIRQITEGRRYFQEHFGVQPRVAYNFDSFGHSGGLPQILNLTGYKMYIHLRPENKDLPIPSDLYRWRGVDGSEILVHRIAVGLYHHERNSLEKEIAEGVEMALRLNRDVPVFWGLGDHGGGATREDLQIIDEIMRRENRVEIIHSSTDYLYECLKDVADDAPLLEGDVQRVFVGSYTSLSRLKRRAQKSISEMVQTEALLTTAWWLLGEDVPTQNLAQTWRDHLFNDFHDILPGTCTEPAEQDALDLYGRIGESLRELRLRALVAFNRGTTREAYLPVTVVNANPSVTKVPVEVEALIDYRPPWVGKWHMRLFKSDRTEIPCQEEQPEALLPFCDWRRKLSFYAELPAVGSANYFMEISEGEREQPEQLPALFHHLDPNLGLVTKLNAGKDRQCLAGPLLQPLVIDDSADAWGTDVWSYREVIGKFELEEESLQQIERGAIRTITESVFTYEHSRIIMHTLAYSQWPVLEYRLRIIWNEEHQRLKLSVPTIFRNENVLCEVPGGIIHRPADAQEHVHGRWFMLAGNVNGKETALGVVNSGQHGLDFSDGEVRLSVLRSARYCHEQGLKLRKYPVRKYMDQGVHEVRLLATAGDTETVKSLLTGLADWLTAPPVALAHLPVGSPGNATSQNLAHKKDSDGMELLSIRPNNIRLLACKPSWDEQSLILRIQESGGVASQAQIKLAYPEKQIHLSLRPLEIKTIRIKKTGEWREVDLVSEG